MAWPTSDRFVATIAANPRIVTACTMTTPGGDPTPLGLSSGNVTSDRTQAIRRTATIAVIGGSAEYEILSTPGTRIAIQHGFQWAGTDRELVPMITGELSSGALPIGDDLIALGVADLWQPLTVMDYLVEYTPDVAARRVDEIITAISAAFPGIEIRNTATDVGTVAVSQAWTSRASLISSFATDGGMEAYFAPDGAFVLRDAPQITDPSAWTIKTGPGGTFSSGTRNRPYDRVFNTVKLTPGTSDSSQDWEQVIAQISDPADPRHPDKIGERVYSYAAPTILTEDGAIAVAAQLLSRMQGATETLALDAVSNMALEAGDIVRATLPTDSGLQIVTHFAQQLTWDLATGGMTANTRSDTDLAA